MKKLCITPINNTVLSIQWLKSPYKFLQRGSPTLQTIFNTWSREVKHMTISDLLDIYGQTEPYFSCTSASLSDFYYTTEESLERCNSILTYQFPEIDARIEFLQQLFLVLTRQNGKKIHYASLDHRAAERHTLSVSYHHSSSRLARYVTLIEMIRFL